MSGRKLDMYDVDAPLEHSAIGVLMRKPGGADPTVPFRVIGEDGFVPARNNREEVIKYFEDNPDIGKYTLYGTKANGEKYVVAEVENGKTQIYDKDAYKELTDKSAPKLEVSRLRGTKIGDAEIARVTKKFPEGEWKQSIIETLKRYLGSTWEDALSKHALE